MKQDANRIKKGIIRTKIEDFSYFCRVKQFKYIIVASILAMCLGAGMLSRAYSPIAIAGVTQVVADTKGRLWAATENGLFRENSDGWMQLMPLPSLTHHPFPSIYALAADSLNSRMWIGAWNHLYCYSLANERFETISDSLICKTVSLKCDSMGRVWAKTQKGLYVLTHSDKAQGECVRQLDSLQYGKRAANPKDQPVLYNNHRSHPKRAIYTGVATLLFLLALTLVLHVARNWGKPTVPTNGQPVPTDEEKKNKKDGEQEKEQGGTMPPPSKRRFVIAAEAVIDRHLSDTDFNAQVFAEEIGMSRSQLFRKMKAACGKTVNELLQERRMTRAAELLVGTNRTVSDIASAVGYSDISSFRRAFIGYFGVSPSHYAKKSREYQP